MTTNILLAAILTTSIAAAATNLTNIQIHSTDAEGNADVQTPHVWNTKNTNGNMKIFITRDDNAKPFLNGPTVQDAEPNLPMTGGTYTYYIFMERYNSVLKPRYALNLFFNLETSPQVSVFAPLNTSSNEYFPDWYPVPAGKRVADYHGRDAKATGKAEFVDGQTKITVTDFSFSAPSIFKLDRVGYFDTKPSTEFDFVGQFTVVVSAPPQISNGGVVNAASFTPRIAPGSLISIFGTDLATTQASATSVPLPTNLGGTSVTVGGKEAPLVFVSPGQVNAQMPYELTEGTSAPVVVTVNGVASPQRNVQVVKAAPGIFQFGEKRAVVQNADFSVNTAENPAAANSYVIAYLTGGGNVDNAVNTGRPASAEPLSRPRAAVTATVGGVGAEVAFAGLTPGFIGLMQVNLKVPGLPAGTHPLLITVDGVQSNAAMITVR
ncbi:MAG TPA: IPT/TIG domain-containing protein [Bryobacteraceae bacterium]|nr:IPT/TIG domain-containing protein [Bryobacteraceae bacterium]